MTTAGHVGAEVGLGHRHRGQELAGGQAGQPAVLLLLGPPVDQGPGQDLGSGDERAADAQRAPAQLLGGHHHAQVVALAAGGEAPVRLGHRQAERPELGQPGDDLLGDVAVGPVDVLGVRPDLLARRSGGRSRPPARSRRRGGAALPARTARPGTSGPGGPPRTGQPGPASRRRRPTPPPGRSVRAARSASGVGHEGAGQAGLGVAPGAVVQGGPGGGHRRGGVGQVVGHHLVGVDPAGCGQGLTARPTTLVGQADGRRCGLEIGCRAGHGATLPVGATARSP